MTQTFTQEVFVDGAADATQLRVQGHTTQTNPLQTWESSAGATLARVTGQGRVQIGDVALGGSTTEALVEALGDLDATTSKPKRGIHAFGKFTASASALADPLTWAVHEFEVWGTAGISTLQTGLRTKITNNNTGSLAGAEVRAADFQTVNQAGISTANGKYAGLRATATNAANKSAQKLVGIEALINNGASGSVAEAVAFEVVLPVNTGTITALYGLKMSDLGSTNFAIQTGTGKVSFGDAVTGPTIQANTAFVVGSSGPRINNNAGVVQIRNNADTGWGDLQAGAGTFNGGFQALNLGQPTFEGPNTGASNLNVLFDSFNSSGTRFIGRAALGTKASPTATQAYNELFGLDARGHTGSGYVTDARALMLMYASENWTTTAQGTSIALHTTRNGTSTREQRLIVTDAGLLVVIPKDTVTNIITDALQLRHNSTGTPAAGFGTGIAMLANSNLTADRQLARLKSFWTDAIDASRRARGVLSAFRVTTEYDCIAWEASSNGTPMVGFYGTAPIEKPTVTGSRGGNAALQSLLTALANLGLVVNSTT